MKTKGRDRERARCLQNEASKVRCLGKKHESIQQHAAVAKSRQAADTCMNSSCHGIKQAEACRELMLEILVQLP